MRSRYSTVFEIFDKKLYIPVVTLSPQDDTKLLKQLKSEFQGTISYNKYQSRVSIQAQYQYLVYLIDPSFQGVNKLSVL